MVASSEQQRPPVIVSKPATAHASSNHPGAPINRDDSADVIKMPEPIIEPITIMVASIGPRARTRPLCCWLLLIPSCLVCRGSRWLPRYAIGVPYRGLRRADFSVFAFQARAQRAR